MPVWIGEDDVRALLGMEDLIPAMESALEAFSSGDVNQPVRTVLDVGPGRGFFALMPAEVRRQDSVCAGAKLVTVFPANAATALPTHQAVIVLHDVQTGEVTAILDGRYITEARTAAVSAVSAKWLARPGTASAAVLGSGVQARSHVGALRSVFPDLRFRAWSPTAANLHRFASQLGVDAATSARDAVSGADLVVLATSSTTPVLRSEWVQDGAHVMAVGACRPNHREIEPELVARARLFVDSRAAAMREAGDLVMAIAEGYFTEAHIAAELGEVFAGRTPGRTSASEITIFKSLGLAVEDVAAANLAFARATSQQRGVKL